MAEKLYIGWVTETGVMIVEEGEDYKDKDAAARAAMKAAFSEEIQRFVPFYMVTLDGSYVGICRPDHFVVLTEEDIQKMQESQ